MSEVSRKFTGIALELMPAPEFVKRKQASPLKLSSWFRIVPAIYAPLAHIIVLSLLMQLFVLAAPLFIQLAIDQAALKGDQQLLKVLALGFALLCFFHTAASMLRNLVTSKLSAVLTWEMTVRLFRHLIRLPLPWYQRRRLADILSRFDAIIPVRNLLSGAMVIVMVDGLLALGTMLMMLALAPSLALLALGGFLLFVLLRLGGLHLTIRFGMEALTARVAESGKRIETVRAIQTVKVMGAESERENDWANTLARTVQAEQKNELAQLSFSSVQALIDGLVRIVLVYAGVRAIIGEQMSVGLFYAFLTYQTQFASRAGALFNQVVNWRMTDMHSFRLADIVLTPKEDGGSTPTSGQPPVRGAISCRGVGFAYGPREPILLNGVSLDIQAGEFVAITGPSGAGKSTLLKIICGLYPASQGEVLVDGHSIGWWGTKSLRRSLGVVMQDDELLAGTIAENVTFFDEHPDPERVRQCLQHAALLDDVMSMPMRTDTHIGDMGSGISGGQRQRLLLARALYRHPRILILDEATSHLDLATERAINRTLSGMNITRIVVAHREETIAAADRVIRLENARVCEDRRTK